MVAGTTPPLRTLYEGAYGDAMRTAHLEGVDLLANFPVATLSFGYSRGDLAPGAARLVAFRDRRQIRAYGSLSRTEALLFRLDPVHVFDISLRVDMHYRTPLMLVLLASDCSRGWSCRTRRRSSTRH